jgi:undecaprenyl-diphosphatase
MNPVNVILLGIVQGLTEFLPISSSGHLVIIQNFLPGFSQPGILLNVILHFGTLFSVGFFFRRKLFSYFNTRYLTLLIIGTLPAAVVGLLFKGQIEALFQSVRVVGWALLVTGVLNLLTDKFKTKTDVITNKNALLTGIVQAVAIIPGVSRSGSTIFASVVQGISKKEAAEFSFILSVPAVLGANILEMASSGDVLTGSYSLYILGFLASFVVGYIAIGLVFKLISSKHFEYFAYYCFALGLLTMIFA